MKNHSAFLEAILPYLGLIYFTAWSVSFYPQLWLNYRRKSATGFSFDFTILNPLGFLCYTLYAVLLRYDPVVREQYARRSDGHEPQVSRADVGFASHAFALSSIGLVQVLYYGWKASRGRRVEHADGQDRGTYAYGALARSEDGEAEDDDHKVHADSRGREELTRWGSWSLVGIAVVLIVEGVLVAIGKQEWLDAVYMISYIKLYISIFKWIPQLIMNHVQRSTEGFSIVTVALDLVGSITSLAELVIASYLANDIPAIWGNPLKLGLSGITLLTDGWFVGQRLVFGEKPLSKRDGGGERERLIEGIS